MSTNKKYVGEEAARVLAAGIGAATPRTWDLTPDDLDSVTEEEQDGMVLMQFPTPARLKVSLADIKTGDRLDASSAFGISACHLTVTTVLRDDASDGTFYHVFASMDSADDGIFRTPTLVPYGSPPSVASDDPADQAGANYAEGTIVGAGKVQNVPYLVVVGAARFGKKPSATAKDDETITAPGIFYVTRPSTNYWYVKFYPLLNKWKELENIAGEILVISAALGIADKKINATRDKLGGVTNAVRPRVIVGRLPRIGSKGTHNYYLTPELPGDGSWIPVSLTTKAFKDLLGDENATEPFNIEAVGLLRVYLSLAPGDPSKYIKPELSPLNITVENGVATISKKTPGAVFLNSFGLHADMAVYKDPSGFGPQPDGSRLIVRYDEDRGWVGCNVPHRAGGFAIDRLAPPTYTEVMAALTGNHIQASGYPFQIQFRSRAVRPKGSTAEDATKKFHFWSLKKKRGCVFRVRRTLGARHFRRNKIEVEEIDSHSYAHRNFMASEWHYYSVRWETSVGADGKKDYRIRALRRLG